MAPHRTPLLLLALVTAASGFAPPATRCATSVARSAPATQRCAPLAAYNDFDANGMRKFRWNLNVGRDPWGFSLNAEVWNGRVAMMGFFWVLIQEAVTGKGCITTIQDAQSFDQLVVPVGIAASFFVIVAAVTAVIANQGDDDFSTSEILEELKQV
mmetsp:Transcript_275/g.787  ORF Transcript_275/g.787 Transcript_275/m.787 type:complete len:156 (-) Transcript_275:45-512(-)